MTLLIIYHGLFPILISDTILRLYANDFSLISVPLDLFSAYQTFSHCSFSPHNGEFQYGTTYDVYIDSHKYAGWFASFSTEGPMSETFREVTFRESGLPKALNWSLEIGGKIYSSSNSTISVFLGPGQYGYFAENESVFYTSNYSGIIDMKIFELPDSLRQNSSVQTQLFLLRLK